MKLLEQRQDIKTTKRKVLRDAVRLGFSDLEQGRFVDVADDQLEGFIASLEKNPTA